MSVPFFLEIGSEEIPDWMIVPALNHLQDAFQRWLDANQVGGKVARVDATPRRLVLRAEGLRTRQEDSTEVLMGPPKSAGEGAARGFAKKTGATVDQLRTEVTPKGEYWKFIRAVPGRNTADLLSEALPGLILGIPWPKTMYWSGKSGPRWIRPIRWLVALLGDDVVPFEIAGVRSGRESQGHRLLGPSGVILSADERRARIERQIEDLIAGRGLRVKPDPDLLHTLVYITEFPTPILGSFEDQYLRLPREVLTTVMRHHQKYFSVEYAATGDLAPHFIAVMNTNADPDGLVRQGNERVLRARFNDARFFWEVDQKKPLAERVDDLAHVTFQAKVGSYLEKTNRVVALVKELGGNQHAQRAALLAKCDLTTEMVKEFTDLQGIVGGLYAKEQGEPEPVWQAIYEHYKPLSMEDSIPSTPEGRILALADKLDTLRECFRVGLMPSGSKDPFALRRAAQGAIRILVEGSVALPFAEAGELRDFLVDRIRYYFREVRGFQYDEVNAVLGSGIRDLPDAAARLEALHRVRPTEDFEPLAASFKRIANILRQAGFSEPGAIDESLLEEGPERDLYTDFDRVRQNTKTCDYLPALEAIATLRPAVDRFFDKVLVNAPDERVRRNRLTLLCNLLTEFSAIADFSEIVPSNT
ncbi:MAG: glycine--tRNA ligase subunit beta [Bryobacteraceae bacterium]|jgi:glycyl-tRNA synthetase beta chain